MTLAQYVITRDGTIVPLLIPANKTSGLGLLNPSIFNDSDKLLVNIRQVNYTFYHSEAKLFQHPYGPLTYVHPENDLHLRTWNWYCELDDNLELTRYSKIDTSAFDNYDPAWDFVGLEDARLVRWDGKLYLSGVRRDTTPNGQGRMELSEISVSDTAIIEHSRFRIPTPRDPNSYCEKNWMPILDLPYHYVKWCNPLEIVKVDPQTKNCTTVFDGSYMEYLGAPRGGSQIISIPGGRLALIHDVDLFKSETGRKDAIYSHRFLMWDEDWKLVAHSKKFSIMGGHVEFAAGMCTYKDKLLISYGFQDNAAYILCTDVNTVMDFINE